MFKIVITNVPYVGTLRIDKIYLGGSLRRIKKRMSSKEKKAKIAELKLRNYIQKKYGKIDLGFVSEGVSQEWLRRWNERISKQRIRKERH
jgi:hypothetical protein